MQNLINLLSTKDTVDIHKLTDELQENLNNELPLIIKMKILKILVQYVRKESEFILSELENRKAEESTFFVETKINKTKDELTNIESKISDISFIEKNLSDIETDINDQIFEHNNDEYEQKINENEINENEFEGNISFNQNMDEFSLKSESIHKKRKLIDKCIEIKNYHQKLTNISNIIRKDEITKNILDLAPLLDLFNRNNNLNLMRNDTTESVANVGDNLIMNDIEPLDNIELNDYEEHLETFESFSQFDVKNGSKKQKAENFNNILILANQGKIKVEQKEEYGDIEVIKTY